MAKLEINRRKFLQGLVAFGASASLATPIEAATPAQIDKAWEELAKKPWFFEVSGRTILDQEVREPETWGDVFEDVASGSSRPDWLILEVEGCEPLTWHFQELAEQKLSEVEDELEVLVDDHDDGTPDANALAHRPTLERLRDALQDADDGWKKWVMLESQTGLPYFNQSIRDWLDSPADYSKSEFFPMDYGSQGGPYSFFANMEADILDSLGIVVVEGEHPGSTYYAAELRQPIEAANAAAEALGLPFRFR